jgi:hypothetical protein
MPESAVAMVERLSAIEPQQLCPFTTRTAPEFRKLRGLCCEMISRLNAEKDLHRFGAIGDHVDAANNSASSLGFNRPVASKVSYDRDADYSQGPFVFFGPSTCPGIQLTTFPQHWRTIRRQHPEYQYVHGFCFYDPVSHQDKRTIFTTALAEPGDPRKPALIDPWAGLCKLEDRKLAIDYISRWVRFIDAILEPAGATRRSPPPAKPLIGYDLDISKWSLPLRPLTGKEIADAMEMSWKIARARLHGVGALKQASRQRWYVNLNAFGVNHAGAPLAFTTECRARLVAAAKKKRHA